MTAGLTNLVFVVVGATIFILLSPTLNLDPILIGVIVFVLLQKSLIVGYVTYSFHKQGRFDSVSGTRVIGFYFGRLFGLFIGAFIGSKIAGGIGALIGALAFYFAGRWVGFKVGFVIGRILDKNLPVADMPEKMVAKPLSSKNSLIIAYAAIFPFLMLLLALFFRLNHIQILSPPEPANTLTTARIVVIALSLFSLVAPWFIQSRMLQKQIPNSAFSLFWIGLGLSFAPVIYGFFLFILGASIFELGVFAVASSLAAIIWSRKLNVENPKAG